MQKHEYPAFELPKGGEVNSMLTVAMRWLTEGQRELLIEALLQRKPGMLYSDQLVERIAEMHKLKSEVNGKIKTIQNELSGLKGESRELKVRLLNSLSAEQAVINERLKEFSVLRTGAVDQLMLRLLKQQHKDIFDNICKQAEKQYQHESN